MEIRNIGHVANETGIPTKTIRFWEEVGLIPQPKRAPNGYRIYELRTVEKLRLIKDARDLGLPIAQIKKLMHGCKDGNCEHTRAYLESEVATYLGLLDEKINQMVTLKGKLRRLQGNITIDKDCPDRALYCCNILAQLVEQKNLSLERR